MSSFRSGLVHSSASKNRPVFDSGKKSKAPSLNSLHHTPPNILLATCSLAPLGKLLRMLPEFLHDVVHPLNPDAKFTRDHSVLQAFHQHLDNMPILDAEVARRSTNFSKSRTSKRLSADNSLEWGCSVMATSSIGTPRRPWAE